MAFFEQVKFETHVRHLCGDMRSGMQTGDQILKLSAGEILVRPVAAEFYYLPKSPHKT